MNEDENMEQDINMMLRTPLGHSPNRSDGTTMDQEVTRVKVISSGASTPVMAVRGEITRMSIASNVLRSEAEDEFWEKDSAATVGFKAHINLDSEIAGTVTTLSGASNSNSSGTKVEANGEAVKDKDDSGLSSNKSDGGLQPDAASNTSDSGLRTSLLNKEAGS